MKRINRMHCSTMLTCLLLAAVMLFGMSPAASAAGPLFHNGSFPEFQLQSTRLPEVTIEGLLAANSYEALLEKHGGFSVETFANTAYVPKENCYSFFYGTENYNFYCYAEESGDQPVTAELTTDRDVFRLTTGEDGSREFGIDWQVVPGWEENWNDLKDGAMALDEEALAGLQIVSADDNGDGTLTVVLAEDADACLTPNAETEEPFCPEDCHVDARDYADAQDGDYDYHFDPNAWDDGYPQGEGDDWIDPYVWDFWPGGEENTYGQFRPFAFDEPRDFDGPGDFDSDRGFDGPEGFDGQENFGDPYGDFRPFAFEGPRGFDEPKDFDEAMDAYGAWYNVPAEDPERDDAWYDNTVTWYEEHSEDGHADSEEPQIVVTLTVDTATLEILKVEQHIFPAGGGEELLLVQVMGYEYPESSLLDELVERGAAHYEWNELLDPRTVTVIFNAGEEDEVTVSRTVEKGDLLYAALPGGYEYYSDEFGTPFFGSDGLSDVTLYAFHEGHEFMFQTEETEETLTETMGSALDEATGGASAGEETPPQFSLVPGEIPVIYDSDEETAPSGETEEEMPALIVEDSIYESAAAVVEEELGAGEDVVVPVADEPVAAEDALSVEMEEPAAEDPEITDEAVELDFDAVNHAIFDANALDRILDRHVSVEYSLLFEEENLQDCPDYIYETREMAYAESPSTSVFVGGGNYYELFESAAGSELYYVFDLCNNYDPILNIGYEIVPEVYEDWWNAEEENALSCYVANGEVHLLSRSSEAKSRDFVENYLQLAYDGEIVTTETVADAGSFELIRFTYIMEKDGELSLPLSYEVRYDAAEPRACRNLRAAAGRDGSDVALVTLVVNPGTGEEITQTKAVPTGSNVVYIAMECMEVFEDPECTIPASAWDKTSDHTYYMLPAGARTAD